MRQLLLLVVLFFQKIILARERCVDFSDLCVTYLDLKVYLVTKGYFTVHVNSFIMDSWAWYSVVLILGMYHQTRSGELAVLLTKPIKTCIGQVDSELQ